MAIFPLAAGGEQGWEVGASCQALEVRASKPRLCSSVRRPASPSALPSSFLSQPPGLWEPIITLFA